MSIEIIPTGAALGAEIRGVDLARPIDDETFAAIECAYNNQAVIFFRDQHITPPLQVALTRRFGEIESSIFGERWSVPGSPEIVVLSNVTEDGRPIGAAPRRRSRAVAPFDLVGYVNTEIYRRKWRAMPPPRPLARQKTGCNFSPQHHRRIASFHL
jgi:alpha-ketoglutarate-dependent taurine dioxygenase